MKKTYILYYPKQAMGNFAFMQICCISILVFFSISFCSCRQAKNNNSDKTINPDQVDSVEFIQVDHPYLGGIVGRKLLDKKYLASFLIDFEDKREEVNKFYSRYVIKIHLTNGRTISYRTNGQLLEKLNDSTTAETYFKLNKNVNVVTKYWGITEQ